MANPLKIAPPPPRPAPQPSPEAVQPVTKPRPTPKAATPKFTQVKEDDRVQFNKRVTRRVADGFEMLKVRARRPVPELLAEALELLEERYGKV